MRKSKKGHTNKSGSENEDSSPVSKRQKFKIPDNINEKFSNFDMLWFDLETKVRDLVLELVQPMNDNVFDTRGIIA
jgi:hypothetical protein